MPKVLVLFDGAEHDAAMLADAAAEGATGVRFAEVDIRIAGDRMGDSASRKNISTNDAIDEYHGVIIAVADRAIPHAIDALLRALEQSTAAAFVDTVFAVVGPFPGALRDRVARLGGIVVSEPRGVSDAKERARHLGGRVAKVVGWVHHALGHEHEHAHAHHHHEHDQATHAHHEQDHQHSHPH